MIITEDNKRALGTALRSMDSLELGNLILQAYKSYKSLSKLISSPVSELSKVRYYHEQLTSSLTTLVEHADSEPEIRLELNRN